MDELLERDDDLAALGAAVDAAADGAGSVVLVSGEAGCGKTALVRSWLDREQDRANVFVGWCDDLSTARPNAPLHDVARTSTGLADALASDDPGAVFDALQDLVADPLRPSVLVVEDVHWADEATMDAVRHLTRRIAVLPAVLVLTYRDDEVGRDHPLLRVLARLAEAPVHRVHPAPLSAAAVATLGAGDAVDADRILAATGGNAFLVAEVLAHDGDGLPASIRDAVLGRVARLDDAGRDLVRTVAVVPGTIDLALVDRLAPDPQALAEVERDGVLVVDGDRCRFRHELLRRAVVDELGRAESRLRHRRVLDALLAEADWAPGDPVQAVADPARLVHFAAGAGDGDVLVALGPHAAGVAHRAGAHDIADRIQRAVLDHAHRLDVDVRARLDLERAWTLYNLGRHEEAMLAADAAVRRHEVLADQPGTVRALVTAARTAYMANDPSAAATRAAEAVRRAEAADDPEVLAEATVAAASHAALVGDAGALVLADLAVARSREVARLDLESLARNYRGVALLHQSGGTAEAEAELELALDLGRRAGDDEAYGRAVLNLLEAHTFTRDRRADEWLARARELDDGSRALDGYRANVELVDANIRIDRGAWDEAARLLASGRAQGLAAGVLAVAWDLAEARLAVRRGAEDADDLLARAIAATAMADADQFTAWMLALRLEHAWLHDLDVDVDVAAREVEAISPGPGWAGELAVAARRVGVDPAALPTVEVGPWAAAAAGDHATAVEELHEAGLPHDAALAAIERGGEADLRQAIEVLDRLGARPGAALARRHLAALGVGSVPRGPNRATRANPAGLTPRQVDVLELLVAGLGNAEIAERLVLSVRTVEDHVSGVLSRLGVDTRDEAGRVGARLLDTGPDGS